MTHTAPAPTRKAQPVLRWPDGRRFDTGFELTTETEIVMAATIAELDERIAELESQARRPRRVLNWERGSSRWLPWLVGSMGRYGGTFRGHCLHTIGSAANILADALGRSSTVSVKD